MNKKLKPAVKLPTTVSELIKARKKVYGRRKGLKSVPRNS